MSILATHNDRASTMWRGNRSPRWPNGVTNGGPQVKKSAPLEADEETSMSGARPFLPLAFSPIYFSARQ